MIVIDASVLVDALTDDTETGEAAAAALRADDQWAGPDHLVLETAAAIRGRWLGGKIDDERAVAALRSLRLAEIVRVDTAVLLDRVWELRTNLTAYDAAYVVAAEALGVALLTGDQRLAAAPGRHCAIMTPTT